MADNPRLTCAHHPQVSITFADPVVEVNPQDSQLFFTVRARSHGLNARLERVTHYVDGLALARFLERLDPAGWDGELSWNSTDRDIFVSAVYDRRGYMRLTWTLSPWRESVQGVWSASVTLWLEGGEARDRFVAELVEFLSAGDHRGEP